jgi:hypothetical protein
MIIGQTLGRNMNTEDSPGDWYLFARGSYLRSVQYVSGVV